MKWKLIISYIIIRQIFLSYPILSHPIYWLSQICWKNSSAFLSNISFTAPMSLSSCENIWDWSAFLIRKCCFMVEYNPKERDSSTSAQLRILNCLPIDVVPWRDASEERHHPTTISSFKNALSDISRPRMYKPISDLTLSSTMLSIEDNISFFSLWQQTAWYRINFCR